MLWNIVAIVLSVVALASSSFLAVRQTLLMNKANHLPAHMELFAQFRSLEFNDHYHFITDRLSLEYDPKLGISGLPDDARKAIYDVAGLFQGVAALRLPEILDHKVDTVVQVRTIRTWKALAPFVERERELQGTSGMYLWRAFEEFAADTALLPAGAINTLIEDQRRRRQRRLAIIRPIKNRRLFLRQPRQGPETTPPAGK